MSSDSNGYFEGLERGSTGTGFANRRLPSKHAEADTGSVPRYSELVTFRAEKETPVDVTIDRGFSA